jgi:hypothetical protein
MARARTQPGRNSCSSEMMVETVAVQPKPHTTSRGERDPRVGYQDDRPEGERERDRC